MIYKNIVNKPSLLGEGARKKIKQKIKVPFRADEAKKNEC